MLLLVQPVEHPGIISFYMGVEDGVPLPVELLTKGLDFIRENRLAGRKVLVVCGAGISRSATFVIAALKDAEQVRLSKAYRDVKRRHPDTMPHPALWKSLCEYFGEETPYPSLIPRARKP
jgi:protein-tyrosine phosphatase